MSVVRVVVLGFLLNGLEFPNLIDFGLMADLGLLKSNWAQKFILKTYQIRKVAQ